MTPATLNPAARRRRRADIACARRRWLLAQPARVADCVDHLTAARPVQSERGENIELLKGEVDQPSEMAHGVSNFNFGASHAWRSPK